MPPSLTETQTEQVRNLLRDGQVVAAVKYCRDETGSSLADAKAAVDQLRSHTDGLAADNAPVAAQRFNLPLLILATTAFWGIAWLAWELLLR